MSSNRSVKVIKAQFVGQDGSLRFIKDKVYTLLVKTDPVHRIYIEDIECGCRKCNYSSIVLFMENWDNIKTKLNLR